MNQEQNNFNQNNFNTQGNNGIPNPQPLNNQNIGQNVSVNQPTVNPQPQPTQTFQQPVMQEPTPQPVNSFETSNVSNQGFDSKPPKNKKNLGMIIGIVCVIAVVIVVAIVFLTNGSTKENNNNSNKDSEVNENNKVSSGELSVESIKAMPETDPSLFEYEEVEGGISITNYTGQDEVVIVPEKIDGKTVLEIGELCFYDNQNLKAVKISQFVEIICDKSFFKCVNLEYFISGKNVKSIGVYAFYCCSKLKYVELNEGLESLAQGTFVSCDFDSIYIPESVTELQYFYYLNEGEKFTVIGKAGSAAEQYAKDNGLEFQVKQ